MPPPLVAAAISPATASALSSATSQMGTPAICAVALQWRCPVLVISDDRRRVGKTVLEEVDSASCEFDVAPGSPTKRAVEEPMERIAI